jgi:hypothetical protein
MQSLNEVVQSKQTRKYGVYRNSTLVFATDNKADAHSYYESNKNDGSGGWKLVENKEAPIVESNQETQSING